MGQLGKYTTVKHDSIYRKHPGAEEASGCWRAEGEENAVWALWDMHLAL